MPVAASAPSGSAATTPDKRPTAATSQAYSGNGWYWNPSEGGTGFMYEAQGNRGFVAFFMYEEGSQKPIWYAAYGDVAPGAGPGASTFTGDLRSYRGGQAAASDTYRSPTPTSVGTVTISFSAGSATVQLPGGRQIAAQRYRIDGSDYDFASPAPPKPHQPEVGWYWNPDEGGRGYAIEVQNDMVFMAMFHYDADGSPTWNVVQGNLATGMLVKPFELYTGGQSLTSAYRGPSKIDLAPFTISFRNPCAGQMQLAGAPVIRLRRFAIDGTSQPAGAECNAVAGLADVPDLGLTTATLAPGDMVFGKIDQADEADAFRIELIAGTTYTFDVKGAPSRSGTLADPVLSIHSASGQQILRNDNLDATSLESRITYTAMASGTHQLRVSSAGPGTGSYLLTATGMADVLVAPTPFVIEAGSLNGSLLGPDPGTLTLTLAADGTIAGRFAPAANPAAPQPVAGSVAPGGVVTFSVTLGSATVTCSGYLGSRRMAGSCGSAGTFVATLVPSLSPAYLVGGTVSGLAPGESLTLLNYGVNALPVNLGGNFWLPVPISPGGAYHVTIAQQPVSQTCTVSDGTGVVGAGSVTSIRVVCSAPTPTPTPTPTPPPPPPPPSTSCNLPDFQASLLARVNQYRAAGASCRSAGQFAPALPLSWNGLLEQAAAGHSIDMAAQNYFSHTSLDSRTMADRINATGYPWRSLGENIAAGYPTVNAVVDGWMASDGHCANIMNPAFQEVGVACVPSSTSTYSNYWTMNLGRPL